MPGPSNALNIIQQGTIYFDGVSQFSGIDASTSGKVLTSNGTGIAPSFQTASGGSLTITGDSGSMTGSSLTLFANQAANTCGATIRFENSGTTSTLNVSDTDANTVFGLTSGSTSLSMGSNTVFGVGCLTGGGESNCVAIGVNCLLGGGGDKNIGIGFRAGNAIAAGTSNVLIGTFAGNLMAIANRNTAIGDTSLYQLVGGSFNTAIGQASGSEYLGSESYNALFNSPGVVGDSQVMRLGDPAIQTTCFIAGVSDVIVPNQEAVSIDPVSKQLGSMLGSPQVVVKTVIVDMTTTGATSLFTPPANFVIIGINAYADTIIGISTFPTVNFGWTATNYDDITSGYQTFSQTQGHYNGQMLNQSNLTDIPFIPASTPFFINVTTADITATANMQRIDVLGYYL